MSRALWLILPLTMLAACTDKGDDDDDGDDEAVDADGDGFDEDEDCDDSDMLVFPGADETCDEVDNDCDGEIDEGDATDASTWYADADGDGYGDEANATDACEAPSGFIADSGDCDDGDEAINPDADEVCDGADNDCDGEVDESDALDASTWYADGDEDGFGDLNSQTTACDQPDGYVTDYTDCDDGDGAVNPDAEELCSTDGVDDDCDGEIDEADAADVSTWYADLDGDGYGDVTSTTVDCDQPSDHVADSTDCDDDDAYTHPFADELCDGVDNDCDSTTSEDGVATFWDTSGVATDYSSTMSGSSSSPAAVTLADDGELSICEGTWYVNLDVQADVDLYGQTGDAEATILDGVLTDTVVHMYTDGITVSVTDLTLQGGFGSEIYYGSDLGVGGGVACYSSDGTASLSLSGVTLVANDADYLGGGLFGYDCTLDIDDSLITENTVGFDAAGMIWMGGDLTISDSEISQNIAEDDVGGIYVADLSGNGFTADFEDVDIVGNVSMDDVGGMAVGDGDLTMSGTTSGASVITENVDGGGDYGGVYIYGGEIVFDTVSFGTSAGGDDNDPYDIYCTGSDYPYYYDDDETVTCDDDLCGSEDTHTVASDDDSADSDNGMRGNVFLADAQGTIHDFEVYGHVEDGEGCDVDFYVLSATSTGAATWTVEWSSSQTVTDDEADWISSGDIGFPVEVGSYYALAVGWDCDDDEYAYAYEGMSSVGEDMGMGDTVGRWLSTDYTADGSSLESSFSTGSFLYLMNTTWSH